MLIEVGIRIEAEDVRLALPLIDLRLELKADVDLAKAAFLERHQIVRLDEVDLEVAALRVVVHAQMKLADANAVLSRVDDDRPSLSCV